MRRVAASVIWRYLRLPKESVYLLSALVLALCAGLAAVGYWYFNSATRLTVAVGPRDGAEQRLLEAYADALVERKRDIRLRIVPADDVRQSAQALQQNKADLAVVRPDVLLPSNSATVAILREETLVILTPAASKITDMAGLAKKRLGLVSHHEADLPILGKILTHYDLAPPNVTLVPLGADEVESAFMAKRIDALAFVAVPVSREAADLTRAVLKASNNKIAVVPVDESEALALKWPTLTAATISPGSLGGRPKQPEADVKTVAVSYRLMARVEKDRGVISRVAQHLFQLRSRIAQGAPSVSLMKAPETETSTSAALPNHQGAIDYFNREQQTFMDRYGDWLWLGLFAGGGVSSGFAWVGQLFARKRRELVDQVLDRLLCILSEARKATSVIALDELAMEIDGLVTHAVRHVRRRKGSTRTMGALMMALDSARAAIADRRRDLLDHQAVEAANTARGPKENAPRLAASSSKA
jgi:TRAP-type uncharacterized transport system substrate-binding protein